MKRKKTVFNTSEIPHLFANQLQENARNQAGNLYFESETIYSYGQHFPIASFDTVDKNKVFFTTDSYSNTTAKHIYKVRAALSHKTLIYCFNPRSARCNNHWINIEAFEKTASKIAEKLERATKPEKYLNEINYQRGLFESYCAAVGLKVDKIKKQYKIKFLYLSDRAEYMALTEKARAKAKRDAIKREKERIKRFKIDLEQFRTFEKGTVYSSNLSYLRYNKETNRVETSKGIEIPAEIAHRSYKWYLSQLAEGCAGDCKHEVMNYQVKELNKDHLVIGCHTIEHSEIKTLANQLGW